MTSEMEKDLILYIDDEAINLSGFKFVFRSQYKVLTAETITSAREILKKHPVKVIISDQKMPEMSGTDFLKSIADEYPDIIKIILTAYADSDTAIEAINEANIYQFLIKPWEKDKMAQTLRNAINAFDLAATNKQLIADLKKQNEQVSLANEQLKSEIKTRLHTERALIQSERKFRQIFSSSSDGIIIWTKEGQVLDANNAVTSILGYDQDKLKTIHVEDLIAPEFHSQTFERALELYAGEDTPATTLDAVSKNGSIIPIEVNSTLITIDTGKAILSMVRDVRLRVESEKAVLNAVVETEERERERFARDLHDDFGPTLSSIKMYLRLLNEQALGKKPDEIIRTIREMVDESIDLVRTTSNQLSSHVLVNYGLVQAINHTVEKFQDFITIDFTTNLETERFHSNSEAIIYRIFNELLNNTMKHANANSVKVHLLLDAGMLTFYYLDDGKGFDLDAKLNDSKGGIGIFNIFSRIRTIGGNYTYETKPGEGVRFTLKSKLPVLEADKKDA